MAKIAALKIGTFAVGLAVLFVEIADSLQPLISYSSFSYQGFAGRQSSSSRLYFSICSSSIGFCALKPGPHSPFLMKSLIGSGVPGCGGGCRVVPSTAQAFLVETVIRSNTSSFVTFHTIKSEPIDNGPS
jgi:hypothetical protein